MDKYPIKPSDIDTSKHFFDSFDNLETEISANYLVRMAQKNGDWRNFTQDEINEFSKHNFWFNNLIDFNQENFLIKKNEDKSFTFTHEFVAKCFLSSPETREL